MKTLWDCFEAAVPLRSSVARSIPPSDDKRKCELILVFLAGGILSCATLLSVVGSWAR
jgi:hypothetical protein